MTRLWSVVSLQTASSQTFNCVGSQPEEEIVTGLSLSIYTVFVFLPLSFAHLWSGKPYLFYDDSNNHLSLSYLGFVKEFGYGISIFLRLSK